MRFAYLALWSVSAIISCAFAQSAVPAPGQLIQRAIAVNKAQEEKGWKFTYREAHAESQVDKNGKTSAPVTKTYDHIMLEGEDYKKLILVEGKPLDAKTQKKVDDDLEKTRAARKKRRAFSFNRTVSLGDLDQLERLFDNKVTGEETILGRKTWRMEAEPKSNYKPANQQEEQALAARHVIWFDQEDGVRVRKTDEFIRAANGFQPGSTVDSTFGKVGEAWLPDTMFLRVELKILPGIRARGESHQRFYDYRRFAVDSTLTPQ